MSTEPAPVILVEGKYSNSDVEALKSKRIWEQLDIYDQQLGELFEIENPDSKTLPDFKKRQAEFIANRKNKPASGSWVYLPWSGYLIHMLGEDDYQILRTNRNRNLITIEEQSRLKDTCVGIAGLSVGSSMAVGLAYSGVSRFKLAELDLLETSNLNRVRAGVQYVGMPKLNITLQQIYEINPYTKIEVFSDGLHSNNVNNFLKDTDVVFDEIDDFEMKVHIRQSAKQAGVSVIMLTALGDNILIDVERYDTAPDIEVFNGLLGDLPSEILKNKIGEKEKIKYAMQIVGLEHIPDRALSSLFEINRTLVGRPQLYSTIVVEGGLAAYLVRRLVLGMELPTGRRYLSFDQALDYSTDTNVNRQELIEKLEGLIK